MTREEEKIQRYAGFIQEESHRTVEYIIKHSEKSITYQDAVNVFLFRKLAELTIKIESLEELVQP